jgi:hypothetical protein
MSLQKAIRGMERTCCSTVKPKWACHTSHNTLTGFLGSMRGVTSIQATTKLLKDRCYERLEGARMLGREFRQRRDRPPVLPNVIAEPSLVAWK